MGKKRWRLLLKCNRIGMIYDCADPSSFHNERGNNMVQDIKVGMKVRKPGNLHVYEVKSVFTFTVADTQRIETTVVLDDGTEEYAFKLLLVFDEKSWAKKALLVQGACNLCGVLHDFSIMCKEMVQSGMGTDQVNKHALSILFSSKVASLTHSEDGLEFSHAYDYAKKFEE
jgi:hypothetical protein